MRHVLLSALFSLALMAAAARVNAEPKTTTIVSGLDNPCGVAIQPGTGDVFLSESAAGRILRVNLGKQPMTTPVVTGWPIDIYGKGPRYKIGPLGIGFLGQDQIISADGGLKDGEELLRQFKIPPAGKTLDYTDTVATSGPLPAGGASARGEGNFYGLAITKKGAYTTANGDDTKGWVLRGPLKNGTLQSKIDPWLATVPKVTTQAPVGICVGQQGEIIIGQAGEINVPKDSLLTIYDEEGNLKFKGNAGLFDITALAVSPKTGKLYAVDFAWMASDQGGLFRLDYDESTGTVSSEKIMSLDKPTAMAFAPDGTLYVTVIGTSESDDQKPGKLMAIVGDL